MSRKLDAAVAEALGYSVMRWTNYPDREGVIILSKAQSMDIPHYCEDGNDMLELDRQMREREFWVAVDYSKYYGFSALYSDKYGSDFRDKADIEPLARALAAHKALTGKEWQEE